MAKFHIVDEVNDSNVTDVLKSGAVKIGGVYTNYFVNSGTASAVAVNASCYLHTINVATSAADAQLLIGDSANASTISNDTSAGLVAKIDLSKRGSYLFDALIANALSYRLTTLNCDGITITYQLA
jgi:hypothetical protein